MGCPETWEFFHRMNTSAWESLIPLALIVVVFWLFVIRPARRRQMASAAMQSKLRVGAEVLLTSGIYGRVNELDAESMQLMVAPGVTLRVHRQAVMNLVDSDSRETGLEPDESPQGDL
jgi:preprotein translocase subunit YajC